VFPPNHPSASISKSCHHKNDTGYFARDVIGEKSRFLMFQARGFEHKGMFRQRRLIVS
jgi:hypothetical protein